MRPTSIGLLGFCVLLAAFSPVRAADLPYQGNWKVSMLDPRFEPTLWILHIDKEAREVKLLWGLRQYGMTKIDNVKTDAQSLSFTATVQNARFLLWIQPPGKNRNRLFGTVRLGANTVPAWLEKTEETELDEKAAVRPLTGGAELPTIGKLTDPKERIKAIREIIARYPDQPIAHLAYQVLLGGLVATRADPATIAATVADYIRLVTPHGPVLVMNTHLNVAQNLVAGGKATAEVALASARAAEKLSRPDLPTDYRMTISLALAAALHLAGKEDETKPLAVTLDKLAGEMIKSARGPDAEFEATGAMGRLLLSSRAPAVAAVGLEYARKVVKLVHKDLAVPRQLAAYRLLGRALQTQGKKEEAASWLAKVEKLEEQLDAEYRKTSIPFEIDRFTKRKGTSNRLVLVELFTSVQNPLCQASDTAFDAARRTYPGTDVVFVQYHLHAPGPDALTNADSEARQKFYGSDLEDIPAVLVDARLTSGMSGERKRARVSYENLREAIDKALEAESEAKLALAVSRKGELIEVKATVSDVRMPGASMKLHLALVEEMVRYQGQNGQRLHYQVLRGLLGGPGGFKVEMKPVTHTATANLATLRQALENHQTVYGKKHNVQFLERALDLKNLRVVAWVQDDDSKKVYQGAQAEVPAGK